MNNNLTISQGSPLPLGATIRNDGIRFSIVSRNAKRVWLLLFEKSQDAKPYMEIEFDKEYFKTGDIWHIFIKGLKAGQLYLYRIDGPFELENGHRFNPNIYLLDPYAKAITGDFKWDFRKAGAYNSHNDTLKPANTMPKCVVIDDYFDWEDDRPLKIPLKDSIIYETHIRGFTVHHSSGVNNPGTYKGIIEKIPYLKKLGITAIELLPVNEFDSIENYRTHPQTGKLLKNYWGYSTILFFAPKGLYSYSLTNVSDSDDISLGHQVNDFKRMVKELHKNGIEVILDVVFNHTSEGQDTGPTLSFKGIDNSIYYILDQDKSKYKNYSGCGNTLNCNHPIVRNLIMDALHYWVNEMHIDGFRFDLASILGRNQKGELMENPPLIEAIAEDPLLRDIKIIAEAWDAGGAYQVGGFQNRWAEWNGKYRDDVRRFWNSNDDGMISLLATRFSGSSDLYCIGRTPSHSINFITAHDGFTLNDLVSYNRKHNEDNGENNRDGSDYDFSFNFGIEGETTDKNIEFKRRKQIKNFITTLLLSQGVPMILGGDEFRRTQKGNNNAYCQDNEISWYDWSLLDKNNEIFLFMKSLIHIRKQHNIFRRDNFFTGKVAESDVIPDISWYKETGEKQDWKKENKTLGVFISGNKQSIGSNENENDAFIIFNTGNEKTSFILPVLPYQKKWYLFIDTSLPMGEDVCLNVRSDKVIQHSYIVKEKSVVVLMSDFA